MERASSSSSCQRSSENFGVRIMMSPGEGGPPPPPCIHCPHARPPTPPYLQPRRTHSLSANTTTPPHHTAPPHTTTPPHGTQYITHHYHITTRHNTTPTHHTPLKTTAHHTSHHSTTSQHPTPPQHTLLHITTHHTCTSPTRPHHNATPNPLAHTTLDHTAYPLHHTPHTVHHTPHKTSTLRTPRNHNTTHSRVTKNESPASQPFFSD